MIQEFIKKVGQFHDAFGQQRGNVDRQLRYKLFMEELEEYQKASKEGDTVEIADAITDMMYIACGTADLHGWMFESDDDTFSTEPEDSIDECMLWIKGLLNLYLRIEAGENQDKNDWWLIIDSLLTLSMHHGIYEILPDLFNEVHSSNMSKLDSSGKPIINDGVMRPDLPVGKILKPDTYRKPDIEAILKKNNMKSC